MGSKTELIRIFDELPSDKQQDVLKLIQNIAEEQKQNADKLKQPKNFKRFLLSIPNVGEDADFARDSDLGREEMKWDS